MRGSSSWAAALLLIIAPLRLAGQGAAGLVGGLNFASIEGDAPRGVSYGTKTGAVFGLFGEIALTEDVSLLLQPTLTQRGTSLGVEVKGMEEPVDSGSVTLSYFSVPVLIRVMAGNQRTFVTGGLDLAFLTGATLKEGSAEEDIKDRLKGSDIAMNFGFGGVVRRGSPAVTVELRYSQSLTNLSNREVEVGGDKLPVRFRSSGFQLLAGVMLPLGGGR